MNRPTIEWTCPEGTDDDIIQSLIQRCAREVRAGETLKDLDQYKLGGYSSVFGGFKSKKTYRLGIAVLNMWHGRDINIKGFLPSESNDTQFSIILCFHDESFNKPLPLEEA